MPKRLPPREERAKRLAEATAADAKRHALTCWHCHAARTTGNLLAYCDHGFRLAQAETRAATGYARVTETAAADAVISLF